MRILCFGVALLACSIGLACNAPQAPPFKAVVETKYLMEDIMERQADIVWGASGAIITPEGVEERRPRNEEEWQAVKAAAVNLTEAGNLLMMYPRIQDGGPWMENVRKMMAQGEKMIAAIDRKDVQAMFDVGSDLYDTCTNCHMHYMPAIKDQYK
jgi:hypothetical protein